MKRASVAMIAIILAFAFPVDGALAHDGKMHPAHNGRIHLPSVGPGEAPHLHTHKNPSVTRVTEISRHPAKMPPPITRKTARTVRVKMVLREVVATLSDGVEYEYWTFDGTVPGPMIRARVGDTVELTLENDADSSHDHSIDLHAVTGPGGGAKISQVAPGKSRTISFKATHPGVYVYHCATPNVPTHMTNGMYGLIVIDPSEGWRPVDREFYIMQGEIYTQGPLAAQGLQAFAPAKMMNERPEYIVFNGRVKALTGTGVLQARQGETIRLFIGNGGVSRISNFHVIGEILDRVHPEASLGTTLTSVQTTLVPTGGATVVELKVENSGDFVLVDHALTRIDRGAYGILTVTGTPDLDLLREVHP